MRRFLCRSLQLQIGSLNLLVSWSRSASDLTEPNNIVPRGKKDDPEPTTSAITATHATHNVMQGLKGIGVDEHVEPAHLCQLGRVRIIGLHDVREAEHPAGLENTRRLLDGPVVFGTGVCEGVLREDGVHACAG